MLIIDRFEGNYAICESDGNEMINIPLKVLPKVVKEGDCIEQVNDTYIIDVEMTNKLKKEIEELTKEMWK